MSKRENVSIVVPIYNAEKNIEKCLNAILNSITSDDEVILVNDASTDDSLEVISKYNYTIINNKMNLGAAAARNSGAALAQKDIIVFVDSDIVINKDQIELIREYFIKHESIQTVTARLSDEKKGDSFFSDFKNLYMNFIILDGELSVNYVYGSLCGTRKKNYVPWPEDVRLIEDSVWGYKQIQLGFTIHLLKDIAPIHLKKYNLYELIKNDFQVSTNFAKSFFQNKRWNTLYGNEKFGHTSKRQKVSVVLAAVSLLFSFFNFFWGAYLFSAWVLLNHAFFKYLHNKRSFSFSLKSISWYYFANIIYFVGIIHGFSLEAGETVKNKFREAT